MPKAVVDAKRAQYLKRGKPPRRTRLINDSSYSIIGTYGAEYTTGRTLRWYPAAAGQERGAHDEDTRRERSLTPLVGQPLPPHVPGDPT